MIFFFQKGGSFGVFSIFSSWPFILDFMLRQHFILVKPNCQFQTAKTAWTDVDRARQIPRGMLCRHIKHKHVIFLHHIPHLCLNRSAQCASIETAINLRDVKNDLARTVEPYARPHPDLRAAQPQQLFALTTSARSS